MLHLLGLRESDKVLEIGSGSGYLTACIASLAASVTAVDIFPELVAMAEQNLADAGVGNVEISCGDAMQELPAGEFDAVLVGGSVAAIPEHFTRALAPSGRLLAVVGSAPVMGAVLVSRQNDGELTSTIAFETQIQALIHAAPRPAFSL
jgi:protein-L-isoaspartate(D-aspartate) O-methyltransferase